MTAAVIVAVVVAYHPDSERLAQLLARLAPQVAHTVCVDNTDAPASSMQASAASRPDAHATVLRLGHNAGIAHAQNLGIARARALGASHVRLMDQDSLPPPNLVAQLLRAMRQPHAQPVAAIGPLCRDVKTGRIMPLIQRQGWRIHRMAPTPTTVPGTPTRDRPVAVEYIPASGSLIDLALFERVGPLQADYFIDRVDVQWCLRARRLGLAIAVHPTVEMAHDQATRTVQLGHRTLYVGHDFRAYFHVRNSLAMALRAPIAPIWRVDQLLKLPGYMVLHMAAAQHGRWRMVRLMAAAVRDAVFCRMGRGHFTGRQLR